MGSQQPVAQRLWSLASDRFCRDGALGLSLTVGLLAVSGLGWAFGEITEAVVKGDDLAAVDSPVTGWLVAHRTPALTQVMRVVTEFGSAWFVISLLVVATVVVVVRRWSRSVVLVPVLSAAGTTFLVTVVKLMIARPRPSVGSVVAVANGFSFPSGHSAQAVATYGALAWLVARGLAGRSSRVAAWLAAAVMVLLIGVSRMYLGVHWLSDVIGGYTIGACWLVLVVTAVTATQRVHHAGESSAAAVHDRPGRGG